MLQRLARAKEQLRAWGRALIATVRQSAGLVCFGSFLAECGAYAVHRPLPDCLMGMFFVATLTGLLCERLGEEDAP